MMPRSLRTLLAIAAAAGLLNCSRGDGGAEPGAAGGLAIPADAAPGDARLMRLIDERVALALARDRATWTVSSGPERVREELAEASRAAREAVDRAVTPALEPVAQEIDALALRVDVALAPGADVDGFAQQVREVLDELVAAAGTVAGDAGAVVQAVRRHIANAITIVEDIGRGRTALAQIAAGTVPDGPLALAAVDERGAAGGAAAFAGERTAAGSRGAGSFVAEHEELPVTAEVLGLRPTSSNTVTLDFALTNRGRDTLRLDWGGFRWTGAGDVALIQLATGQRYPVLRDDQGARMATSEQVARRLAPGERREFWARYRLDPGVERVSVSIPGFPPIDDVPVPH